MLSPDDRALLLESLRPPAGFELNLAVGTSYTLDLVALLRIPLAFAFFDWEDDTGRVVGDRLALFEAIRTTADRLTVFCDVGRIQVPRDRNSLYSRLEDCVCEVRAPRTNACFHPKVWVLRFVDKERLPIYRLLVASRNLTFDRSWDTLLTLDGVTGERSAGNEPLADFVEQLVGLGKATLGKDRAKAIRELAEEMRSVSWTLPDGFSGTPMFWHLGLKGSSDWDVFAGHKGRTLVVSPFVQSTALGRIGRPETMTLVSRDEELAALPDGVPQGVTALCLVPESGPDASLEDATVVTADAETGELETDAADRADDDRLEGLHAKFYLLEDSRSKRVRVLTGSANATTAAFERNVEFMVELPGVRERHGIDAFLNGTSRQPGMQALLVPFRSPDAPLEPDDNQLLEQAADRVRDALCACEFSGSCAADEDAWQLTFVGRPRTRPDDNARITMRPVSLSRAAAVLLDPGASEWNVSFHVNGITSLTQFVAFEVTMTGEGGARVTKEFVRQIPVTGIPAERGDAIAAEILSRERVLRYLLFLASFDPTSKTPDALAGSAMVLARGAEAADHVFGGFGPTLLEAMLKMLVGAPARLTRVDSFIRELETNPETAGWVADLLPIWAPIREVWEASRPRSARGGRAD